MWQPFSIPQWNLRYVIFHVHFFESVFNWYFIVTKINIDRKQFLPQVCCFLYTFSFRILPRSYLRGMHHMYPKNYKFTSKIKLYIITQRFPSLLLDKLCSSKQFSIQLTHSNYNCIVVGSHMFEGSVLTAT